MNLSAAHIKPGRVLQVVDDFGTIKACCCGLFSDQDEPDKIPPMYPFPFQAANGFSKLQEGDEIWVISFDDNNMELFYIRKDNIKKELNDLLSNSYEEVEVLASKEMPLGMIQLYFTDGDGWIIRNVNSVINIRKDGSILLDSGSAHRKIDICDNSISIGSEGGSTHSAAYGDSVEVSLTILNNLLDAISVSAKKNPYTAFIGSTIDLFRPLFEQTIENISSPHVTLD